LIELIDVIATAFLDQFAPVIAPELRLDL